MGLSFLRLYALYSTYISPLFKSPELCFAFHISFRPWIGSSFSAPLPSAISVRLTSSKSVSFFTLFRLYTSFSVLKFYSENAPMSGIVLTIKVKKKIQIKVNLCYTEKKIVTRHEKYRDEVILNRHFSCKLSMYENCRLRHLDIYSSLYRDEDFRKLDCMRNVEKEWN